MDDKDLVLYSNTVACDDTSISWHGLPTVPFLVEYGHATSDQYLRWVSGQHYSAVLPDGSLLQMSYRMMGGQVTYHRLAYVPCPVIVDEDYLREGESIADVVDSYLEADALTVVLRSPVRFDFDPNSARDGHPAAHMTINGPDCRIACVAPLHPYRFIDFVFRHFYPVLYASEPGWFAAAARQHLGERVLALEDASAVHFAWRLHA
jgi:hypothetical protein